MDIMDTREWYGFRAEPFLFEGKKALIVFPNKADDKHNWTLKTEYWGAFPEREIDLLNRGFHAAFLQNETRFATRSDCDRKARFCEYAAAHYGLRDRCVPVGFSCGGAHAVNFAGYHPDKVCCLFLDAPVLNFCDFPGRLGDIGYQSVWEKEFTVAYPGVERYDLLAFPDQPLNRARTLVAEKIPVVMAYSLADNVVLYEQNGRLLESAYAAEPSLMLAIERDGDHHPHGGVADPDALLAFILTACR